MGDEGRFDRLRRVFGAAGFAAIRAATVAVVGIGGVGSNCAVSLARGGAGRLVLVDGDEVAESNMNRQAFAVERTLGMRKVAAASMLLADIAPTTEVVTIDAFVGFDDAAEVFRGVGRIDYLIDAVDAVRVKAELACFAQAEGIPHVCCLGTACKLYPEALAFTDVFETSDDALARAMRKECRRRGIPSLPVLYSRERIDSRSDRPVRGEPLGSTSFTPAVAGYLLAAKALRQLSGMEGDDAF